jgi:A/G-specific adenine glycosylase
MARSTPDKPNPLLLQKPLLQWYDRNKRDLPWRGIHNPYATFVSEMMLQQTQVKTVIPYYHRFLKELPDWNSLAKAKEEKVLKLWEGLGYYRRARNLQAAAQKVVQEYGGKLPDTMEEITKLPGVGPYSAGAVLSIAFQKSHPVVDGNVIRVFSRLFLLRGNLKNGEGHRKVWELAHHLIPEARPGDFNQAVMELGATLCFSDNPQCLLCPLLSQCRASQKGLQNELPEMPKAQETVEIQMAAFLIREKDKVLVKKRSQEEKWLKGMWEFPSAEGKTFEEARAKLDRELKTESDRRPSLEVRHQITHHKVRLRLFPSPAPKDPRLSKDFKWATGKELLRLPFASAQNKLRRWVLEQTGKTPETPALPDLLSKSKPRRK